MMGKDENRKAEEGEEVVAEDSALGGGVQSLADVDPAYAGTPAEDVPVEPALEPDEADDETEDDGDADKE